MKKKGSQTRECKPATKTPDPRRMAEVAGAAAFGDDAGNPLLWQLMNARFHLVVCREESPDQPLTTALREVSTRRKKQAAPPSKHAEFYEALFQALLDRNADFFREVARLLETRVGGAERRMDFEVAKAYSHLCARASRNGRKLPATKKVVREAALFAVAFSNVLRRNPSPNAYWEMHEELDGVSALVLKPEVRKEILREVERLPEQNWTRIFKRCGLAHLPNDKGGQRTHRSRR